MSYETLVYNQPIDELADSQREWAARDPSLTYDQQLALAYYDPYSDY